MLSVAKLAPGQEAYYERSVAQGLDDYYAGRGESPGVWAGRGSSELDLVGVVGDGDLSRLISGIDPATGERLREHAKARTITVERIDRQTGERRTEQRELRPVAGFDLVFGAPKSVSLLHALGDHDTRLAVSQAHESAWQAALAYLEDEACVTRRGRAGIVREHAGGFVAAAYQHRTSRAHDPHLHTHVIVANMAQSPDGTWRALEGDAILQGYRLAAGYLYQSHLRAALSRTLGVEWRDPVKGMAEIRGPNRIVVGDTELAGGDRIICRRNDRALDVRNGTRATILDVDERARAITIRTDRDDTLTLPRRYLDDGHVQLGYAMTGHSSQSLTVERAFVLAPDHGEQREWGYVALSRARRTTRIYVTEAALEVETHAPGRDRPDGLDRLARALAAPAARPLAHSVDQERSIGLGL